MFALRAFFLAHRRLAALLLAMALCMKVLIPAGYMIGQQSTQLTVQICAEPGDSGHVRQLAIATHGKGGEQAPDQGKADSICPYSALSMATLGGADAPLLAAALAFILALGFAAPPILRTSRIHHLRPPLRGPPALA